MGDTGRKGLAELVGTFALAFIGGAAIINGQAGLIGIALAHGLVLAVMVSCLGHISGGHFNPAVTAGFLVTRRMSPGEGGVYVAAQLVGATLAAIVLLAFFPGAMEAQLGGQALAPEISMGAGIGIEAVLTFLLVFAVFATAVDEKGAFKMIAGFGIGLTLAVSILAAGPLTGASLNPARSFGPALIGRFLELEHLVYWVGPLLGGVVAALVYDNLLLARGSSTD